MTIGSWRLFFAVAAVAVFSIVSSAQTPSPTPESDVVKITTKLVQLDVVVTDKKGDPVPGLTAADFEILQDGKPQKITAFSFVDRAQQIANALNAPEKGKAASLTSRVSVADAARIITFIVEDSNCGVSAGGVNAAKDGIIKFIRQQMLPNDLVAIYETREGSSMLQRFTNDKEQLLKVAGKIRWYPPRVNGCDNSTGDATPAARNDQIGSKPAESAAEKSIREHNEDMARDNQIVSTLGVVNYVLKGLARIPGRKLVFYMGEGLPLRSRGREILNAEDSLRDLTELANRASVVFNTVDTRGVEVPMIEAKDVVQVKEDIRATDNIINGRIDQRIRDDEGMAFMANETGGKYYKNNNDLTASIKRALTSELSYYLLAYEPDEGTFRNKKFNRIEVKVARPNLNVSSRTGFRGESDIVRQPKYKTGEGELYAAIAAPIEEPGLDLQLTANYINTPAGDFVRSLVHVGGDEISFTDQPNGLKKAVLDVVAVTLDEKNQVVDQFNRTHTVSFDAATAELVKKRGIVYSADIPIKKPGVYNFRVAIRDANSKNLGSASEVIQIPDLKKGQISLSNLTVTSVDKAGKFNLPEAATAETAVSLPESPAVPAIRRFSAGSIVAYAYTIYNARLDRTTDLPRLTIQMNLYKDGKLIVEGKPIPADLQKQSDLSRISDFAYMRLAQDMDPGEYTIQVIAKDLLAPEKRSTSSQWIDLTVVR